MIWTIMRKEIKDSFRDKRAFFFALIYGPFLMPAMMIAPAILSMEKINKVHSSAQTVYVVGADSTPNFIQFLRSRNIDAVNADENYRQRLRDGDYHVVIEVTEDFGESLMSGEPVHLLLSYFSESTESRELVNVVRNTINQYGTQIVAQRMFARGLDQKIFKPFDVVVDDLAEKDGFLETLSRLVLFLIVFPMVMGAFYTAVDLIAGEKERKTMEPLLSLSVPQSQLLGGKYLAILAFCLLCTVIVVLNILGWVMFVPDQFYEVKSLLNIATVIKLLMIVLPLAFFISSLLLLFSAFAKSVKEAQTQLGFVMLVIMSPMLILQFYKGDLPFFVDYIPVLGLYVTTKSIVFDPGFSIFPMFGVIASNLVFTCVCFFAALRMFKRDGFLQ